MGRDHRASKNSRYNITLLTFLDIPESLRNLRLCLQSRRRHRTRIKRAPILPGRAHSRGTEQRNEGSWICLCNRKYKAKRVYLRVTDWGKSSSRCKGDDWGFRVARLVYRWMHKWAGWDTEQEKRLRRSNGLCKACTGSSGLAQLRPQRAALPTRRKENFTPYEEVRLHPWVRGRPSANEAE